MGKKQVFQEGCSSVDALASFLTLGERINHAVTHSIKEQTAADLSRAIGISHTTLVSMRDKARETSRDWQVVQRLALETGWSYEWLRNGKGRQPRKLEEEDAAKLRAELAAQPGAVQAATPAQTGQLSIINPMLFAQVWHMVCTHERVQREEWGAGESIPCAIFLYNAIVENPARKTDAAFISAFVAAHDVALNRLM